MKLLIIYGPPAVGKLTTAKKLSEITGYCAFHSHLAIDLVSSITPESSNYKKYSDFLSKIIYDCMEFAWKNRQRAIIIQLTIYIFIAGKLPSFRWEMKANATTKHI